MLEFLVEIIWIDFHFASKYDKLSMVKCLFQLDKNIDNHQRALCIAIWEGHTNIFKFFVDNNCLANIDKNNLLKIINRRERSSILKILSDIDLLHADHYQKNICFESNHIFFSTYT